jgi:putative membrane protein
MRLVFLLLALLCVAAGVLFGALNPDPARVDFYWFGLDASLGVLLLAFAFLGAVLGGVALLIGVIWPLQARLRKSRRSQAAQAVAAPIPQEPDPA